MPEGSSRAPSWPICRDGDALRWVGVVLFAAVGALRIWPVFVLRRRFSGLVAIQPGHKLVTSGVYRVIRHPSYRGCSLTRWDGRSLFAQVRDIAHSAAHSA